MEIENQEEGKNLANDCKNFVKSDKKLTGMQKFMI